MIAIWVDPSCLLYVIRVGVLLHMSASCAFVREQQHTGVVLDAASVRACHAVSTQCQHEQSPVQQLNLLVVTHEGQEKLCHTNTLNNLTLVLDLTFYAHPSNVFRS